MYLAHVPGQFDIVSKEENLYLTLYIYIFQELKTQVQILFLDLHVIPLSRKWMRKKKKRQLEKIYIYIGK